MTKTFASQAAERHCARKMLGSVDADLRELISRLERISSRLSPHDSQHRVQKTGAAAAGDDEDGGPDQDAFSRTKRSMIEKLGDFRKLLEGYHRRGGGGGGGFDKDSIAATARMRELLRQLTDEQTDLDAEVRKMRRASSRGGKDPVVAARERLAGMLRAETERSRELLRLVTTGGGVGSDVTAQLAALGAGVGAAAAAGNTFDAEARGDAAIAAAGNSSAVFHGGASRVGWSVGASSASSAQYRAGNGSMPAGATVVEQAALREIATRNAAIDRQLEALSHGLEGLGVLAARQGDEVRKQREILSQVEGQVQDVLHRVDSANRRIKGQLDQLSRPADKICVDIFCLLITAGLLSVLYRLVSS